MNKNEPSFDAWKKMAIDEKLKITRNWCLFNTKANGTLPKAILKKFLQNVNVRDQIIKVEFGRQGLGDVLYLFVSVENGSKVRLPKFCDEVFPVKKMMRSTSSDTGENSPGENAPDAGRK